MPRVPAVTTPRIHHVLFAAPLLFATACLPLWAADAQEASDEMRADCRAEGEAGGLEGAELESFVRECVADLLAVKIENLDD